MLTLITVKPSLKLALSALMLYLSLVITLVVNALPWYFKIGVLFFLITNITDYFKRHILLRHPESIIAFWRDSDGFWSLQMNNSEIKNAYLQKNTVVTHFLILLNFYTEDSNKVSIILRPESVGAQTYRRLLVDLHHNKKAFMCRE